MKTLLFFATLTIIPLVRGFRGGLTQSIFRRTPMPTLSKKCSFDSVCLLSSSFSSSKARMHSTRRFSTPQEEEAIKNLLDGVEFDGETPEVIRLNPNAEDMDDALFENLQGSEPSELLVMKDVSKRGTFEKWPNAFCSLRYSPCVSFYCHLVLRLCFLIVSQSLVLDWKLQLSIYSSWASTSLLTSWEL